MPSKSTQGVKHANYASNSKRQSKHFQSHSDLNYQIEKNTNAQIHTMSLEDEERFQETLRLLEKGELKFMSLEEAKAKTNKKLA